MAEFRNSAWRRSMAGNWQVHPKQTALLTSISFRYQMASNVYFFCCFHTGFVEKCRERHLLIIKKKQHQTTRGEGIRVWGGQAGQSHPPRQGAGQLKSPTPRQVKGGFIIGCRISNDCFPCSQPPEGQPNLKIRPGEGPWLGIDKFTQVRLLTSIFFRYQNFTGNLIGHLISHLIGNIFIYIYI